MIVDGLPWDPFTPKGLVLDLVALTTIYSIGRWITLIASHLFSSDTTPRVGKWFTLRDVFQDVGLDNDTRKAIEEGYYKVIRRLFPPSRGFIVSDKLSCSMQKKARLSG